METLDLNVLRRIACPPEIQDKLDKALTSLLDLQTAARPVLTAIREALEAYEEHHKVLGEELKGLPTAKRSLDATLEAAFYDLTPEVGALHDALFELETLSAKARGDG